MEALLQNIAEPPKIRVVVRKRPLTQNEGQSRDIVDVEGVGQLAVKEIKYVTELETCLRRGLLLSFMQEREHWQNFNMYSSCAFFLIFVSHFLQNEGGFNQVY